MKYAIKNMKILKDWPETFDRLETSLIENPSQNALRGVLSGATGLQI